jgi:serine/threonine protein kinase
MPGQVLGTMAYAAPEQIQEGDIDSRIDIYSLGIVLYELLTGKLPFEGETSFDFLMARIMEPPRALLEANPDVSPIFIPIINKALAQEPAERYQTMDEFSQALVEARQQLRMEEYERMRGSAGRRSGTPGPTSVLDTEQLGRSSVALKLTATGEQIPVENKSELIVGRAYKKSRPDIDLGPYGATQAGVSRRHGRFVRRGNDWFVEDLSSTNGTFVNGAKIPSNQLTSVKKGDKIRFGQIELEFRLDS